MSRVQLFYPEEYIESVFYVWFRAGAPRLKNAVGTSTRQAQEFMKTIPPTEDGRTPVMGTILEWHNKFGWAERAEGLNEEANRQVEIEVVKERVATLREAAARGRRLAQKGEEFILESQNPFGDNPAAAVRAIIAGTEMEAKYAGQASILDRITTMSDKQLEKEILYYLGKEQQNENEKDENVVDVEAEDVEDDAEDDNP